MGTNRVILNGNLTREPTLRKSKVGMPILHFTIAQEDRMKNSQTQKWSSYTNFFNCVLFGKRADALSRILTKGTRVSIDGKLRWEAWEKEGRRHSAVKVIVDELEILSIKKASDEAAADEGVSDDFADGSSGAAVSHVGGMMIAGLEFEEVMGEE